VAKPATRLGEAHEDQHLARCESRGKSQLFEHLVVAEGRLAEKSLVTTGEAKLRFTVVKLWSYLDESRSIGSGIDSQGVNGLCLFVGAAAQLVSATQQKWKIRVDVGRLDFGSLIATDAAEIAVYDRLGDEFSRFFGEC
jgi:hypothetical protein